jgi:glycosyltransferase involved in cell wall biosynthesis
VSAARLSACIISFQEADRIGDCLRSLAFCDEIVVVDSGSTDGTADVARALGARVIVRDWPGFVAQKEFAVRAAAHDWVLCLDSDERLSATLRREIEELRARGFPGASGWTMPRCTSYLGRWIRRGGWYPDRQLRLWDRRRGHWGGNDPHDRVELEGPVAALSGDILHDSYRSFADHLRTVDRYTTIMAEGLNARGRRVRAIDLVSHPLARFVRFYVLKLGLLDGWRGFVIASMAAYYGFLKYAKLAALQRGERTTRPADAAPGTFESTDDTVHVRPAHEPHQPHEVLR